MQARISNRPYVSDPEDLKRIGMKFAEELKKELGALIKSVVLFGSTTKTRFSGGKKPIPESLRDEILFSSDIDVLIVFDDLVNVLNPEVITAYRVVTENVASKISKRLHITTMKLTKFWDYCQKGDPILINMLREGIPLMDSGIFGMAKRMLSGKQIKPTRETIWIYLANGPLSINTAKWNVKQAVMDLYWGVMDAAHSALLHRGVVPDSPDHVVDLFNKHIVKNRLADKKQLHTLSEFHNVGKMVMRGELNKVSGDQYDRYRRDADEFVHAVKDILYSK